jgi:hypothetical protein
MKERLATLGRGFHAAENDKNTLVYEPDMWLQ